MKIYRLQILRTIAASLVIIDHCLGAIGEELGMPAWNADFRANLGDIGVDIFFVISGFIMINSTYEKFGSARSFMAFLRNRFIRIVPLYWIASIIFYVNTAHKFEPPSNLIKSLFFIPFKNVAGFLAPVLGVGWTLNYEMLFYFLFSLSLLLTRRIGFTMVVSVLLGLPVIGILIDASERATIASSFPEFFTNPIITLFGAGMAIGYFLKSTKFKLFIPFPTPIILSVLSTEIFVCWFFDVDERRNITFNAMFYVPLIFAVFVAAIPASRLPTTTETLIAYFGDASYCTYLFHLFAIAALRRIVHITDLPSTVAFGLGALVFANILGLVIEEFLGKPLTKRLLAVRLSVA